MKKDAKARVGPAKPEVRSSTPKGTPRPGEPRVSGALRPQDEARGLLGMEQMLLERSRPTQGNRKALQRLDEMWQNKTVQAEWSEIRSIRDPMERGRRLEKFAIDHRLDTSVGAIFLQLHFGDKPGFADPHLDFCKIIDEAESSSNDAGALSLRAGSNRSRLAALYPIHVGISPLASERDVLDFVKKRWPVIRKSLDAYQEKPPTIRRKRKAARDRFIWENREIPSAQLAEMVNARFPGESLDYYQVDSIKHYMKKRNS